MLVVVFRTTKNGSLFKLFRGVVVVVFVTYDRVDELKRVTIVIEMLRERSDGGEGGGSGVLRSDTQVLRVRKSQGPR